MIRATQTAIAGGQAAPEGFCLHTEQTWWSQKCQCGHALLMHEETTRMIGSDGQIIPEGAGSPDDAVTVELARCAFCLITADIAKRDQTRAEEISSLAKEVGDLGESIKAGVAEVLPDPVIGPVPVLEPVPEPAPAPMPVLEPAAVIDPMVTVEPLPALEAAPETEPTK